MWLPSKIAKARIAKRRAGARTSVDSWPFLGVSIALLIIFMLIPGHSPHGMVLADLPLTSSAVPQRTAIRDDAIRVTVTRDGMVFFRNTKIVPEELPELIRQATREGAERKVYLAVDARAKYADAGAVIDKIREAGIRDLTMMADGTANH